MSLRYTRSVAGCRLSFSGLLLLAVSVAAPSAYAERLKDIADLRGVRPNRLLGYGLVVGLSGTGDDTTASFNVESTISMLKRLGVHVNEERLRLRNVAAVIVTAEMPAMVGAGQRVDVTVSSIGNATSLEGGTLVATPLKGLDLQVYAVAEGPLSVGGYSAQGRTGTRVTKNHTTVGRIPGGALVEREIPVKLDAHEMLINLRTPDFTTAVRVAGAISEVMTKKFPEPEAAATDVDAKSDAEKKADGDKPADTEKKPGAAQSTPIGLGAPRVEARDAGTIVVRVPFGYEKRVAEVMAELEGLDVTPDGHTKVVVNERTGTVILGDGVRLSPVAIAHGGLTVEVQESLAASQPAPFGKGKTVVLPNTRAAATETPGKLQAVGATASLKDVVNALNALGVSPRDLVAILQALKASGALKAELEIQ